MEIKIIKDIRTTVKKRENRKGKMGEYRKETNSQTD